MLGETLRAPIMTGDMPLVLAPRTPARTSGWSRWPCTPRNSVAGKAIHLLPRVRFQQQLLDGSWFPGLRPDEVLESHEDPRRAQWSRTCPFYLQTAKSESQMLTAVQGPSRAGRDRAPGARLFLVPHVPTPAPHTPLPSKARGKSKCSLGKPSFWGPSSAPLSHGDLFVAGTETHPGSPSARTERFAQRRRTGDDLGGEGLSSALRDACCSPLSSSFPGWEL